MRAHDARTAFRKEFEERRKELIEYFLGDMLDLYTAYDEIEDYQTLVISIDLEDDKPEQNICEQWGFSSN